MSFEEQERALFDLLFDNVIRQQFCKDPVAALIDYDLDETEIADFDEIRPDALVLDAKMRRNILLTHICRAFPISFAIVSSLNDGRSLLKSLVDTQTMCANSLERPTVFGRRLRDELAKFTFDAHTDQALIIAILEAELAMALTGASLKKEVMDSGQEPGESLPIAKDWSSRAVKLAAHVGAAIIPQPYAELKRAFCNVSDAQLWTHLGHSPVSKTLRNKVLKNEVPRLLVIRARISHMSLCEPTVDHQTVELSDGFAPLFQHINGSMSIDQILAQLKQTGAPEQILQGVRAGFLQLLEHGMLELI